MTLQWRWLSLERRAHSGSCVFNKSVVTQKNAHHQNVALVMSCESESCVRGGAWFTSLDLTDVFLPCSYSQGLQEVSLCHLHECGICLTVTTIRLLPGSEHLLIVCGGCAGATQASRDKDIILYLNNLLVLSHSEEET